MELKYVYVVCNNDAMLSAYLDRTAAEAEVARLKSKQPDGMYFYHIHDVPIKG